MSFLDLLARYGHLLFALVWVGHNYANFVQNPRFVPLHNGIDVTTLNRDLEARMKREHGIRRRIAGADFLYRAAFDQVGVFPFCDHRQAGFHFHVER
ncbi:MAG: hypothetical protein B7Z23_02425, partial [Pseudomonadales bacterium 32-61-5]